MPVTDSSAPTGTIPEAHPESEIALGATLGRYIVVGVLGHGGMGTVYRAYDAQLDRAVAIKVLHRELARGEEGDAIGARMLREAQAMARLRHPNVVIVHDVGTYENRVYLAMEFVDGGTLRDWLKGERTVAERLAVLKSAGRGLAAAHAAGLIHRDFKPDNVLVGRDGRVLVSDFGIARMADGSGTSGVSSIPPPRPAPSDPPPGAGVTASSFTSALTRTGSILGTIGFMAPEQGFGEATNAASDQFSFCVTAYLALYGQRPFDGYRVDDYLSAIERPLPPPPPGSNVPAWIRRIVARGLSRAPEERFPSMEALLAALDDDPALRQRKRQRSVAMAALAAVTVAAGVGFAASSRADPCAPDPADLRGVWDDAARADVAAAFERSGAPGASEVATRVIKVLDDTASRWTAMKAESCSATRVKARQPEDAFHLRSECLDRRLAELRALSGSLRAADPAVVDKALSASYGLTNVATCADVPMLRKSGGLPDAPEARAKVESAQAELTRASSLQLVGKVGESTTVAEQGLALARASGHPGTVAEALRLLGALKVEQNEHAQAEPFLTEATWTASRAGADSLVVASASMEAFVVGSKLGRPGEARIWLGVADAALGRVGGSPELELELEEHRAWIVSDGEGRPEETIPAQERIVQTYQQLYGVHPRTLRALYNLGDARTSAGEHARACALYERALTMAEAIGGPRYEWAGYSLAGLGDCDIAQGSYAKGDDALARAIAIFQASDDAYSEAEASEVVIRSALAQGDKARALARAKKTLALMRGLEGTASLVPLVNVAVAEALMTSAPAPEAEALCAEALKQQELLAGIDPAKTLRSDPLRCLGDARILAGHPKDAIAPLERSLAIPRRTYPGDLARARFALARALRLSGGDAARATELARQARDELAAAPGLEVETNAVRAWLAAP